MSHQDDEPTYEELLDGAFLSEEIRQRVRSAAQATTGLKALPEDHRLASILAGVGAAFVDAAKDCAALNPGVRARDCIHAALQGLLADVETEALQ